MSAQNVIRAVKTPITLLALLALLAWAAQWALGAATAPVPKRPLDPCVVTQVGEQLTPDRVFVQVLNGTETSGLAKRLATFLRADGFRTFRTGNTETPGVENSVVVGYSEDSPEVVLVRQAFVDIAFRADGRADRTVDVIIGTQQPVPNPAPEFNVPLPDGTACLARIPIVNSEG